MKIVNDINAEDLFELRKQLGWKDINIEQIKKGLKNTEYKISIYEDDTMVACGRIVSDYSFKGVLSDVMVNPDYQGKGYGKIVVTTLFKNVRDNLKVGEKYQIEATPTSGNRDFYVKCGMKYKPEVQDGTFLWIDKSLHKLHLLDKYFCLIKDGSKTVEIRLNDEKRKKMKVGNYIDFINKDTEEIVTTEIVDKKLFDSVNDLYDIYDEKSIGISKKDILKVMRNIYSEDELNDNKICALEIKKIK